MKKKSLKNIMISGGLTMDEFSRIRPLIWQRNKRILRITSMMSAIMGFIFLIYVLITRTSMWFPYVILMSGSVLIYTLNRMSFKKDNIVYNSMLCYGQMTIICVYAGILSVQASNYGIPATSIVVFISVLPLSIDDRLVRMFCFIFTESAVYLVVSKFMKSPEAFSLDVMNVCTFCVISMVLYGVICTRNIRQIYQDVRISSIQENIISSMAAVVEERDESTGGHIMRTGEYVSGLIEKMKKHEKYSHLKNSYYDNIMLAAPMHDIGKIKISDAILNKPGRLTEEEFEIMKTHTVLGAEIIEKTMHNIEEEDYFEVACNIAKYHHERYDGKGYPEGISKDDIPLEARIMALADVYDALVSERVYKKALPKEEARRIIEEGSGTQFDPTLTKLFLSYIDHPDKR